MMIRPVLLAVLVVCSLGASFVAVQPAAADGTLESPLPHESDGGDRNSTDDGTSGDSDGAESTPDDERDADEDEEDDGWYDRWRSDRENRSDDRSAEDDGDRGTNGTTDDGENASSAGDDGDGNDGPDRYGDADERDDDADESDRDGDRENRSHVVPDELLIDETVEWVTERAAGDVADVYRGPGSDAISDGVPDLGGRDRPDARNDSPGAAPSDVADRGEPTRDRTAAPAGPDGPAEAVSTEQTAPDTSDPDDADGGDGDERDGSEVPAPPSGAGTGVALFVTVGYLGGTRAAVTQANLLATTAPEGTLASVRAFVGEYLPGRPDVVAPAVVGYSRHDGSDPLENDTRAAIYDQVRESPGIYHARLAEETDVAVETVRYHCRILAEEGLVEPRKHRGKRRLYPVSMDGDDPELGAAMADSAAADVLSAIERLEPATISSVAEHVDCAPSTVTYHLDRLEEDGLVTRERDGGAVQVRLRRDARSALQTSVADD